MSTKTEPSCPTISAITTLIGSIVLLVGLYCSIKIGVNSIIFDRYPTTGVLQIASFPMYSQREEDCDFSTPYYSYEGKPRSATEAEVKIETEQAERCMSSIQETRRVSFIQDIGTAAFFLFMGIGILISKRFITRS